MPPVWPGSVRKIASMRKPFVSMSRSRDRLRISAGAQLRIRDRAELVAAVQRESASVQSSSAPFT